MTGPTVEQIARAIHGAGCCDITDLRREMDAARRVLALLPPHRHEPVCGANLTAGRAK